MRQAFVTFCALAALAGATGCATLIEGASQEVTFEATGATDVMCFLSTGELNYKVYPPQRVWLKRSRPDMTADCYAPGNRRKQFKIVTGVEPWTAANVSNGVAPGVAYDAYSRAFFKYPSVIVFDMSDTVATPDLLPSYHNGDGLNPKHARIEYMGPDTPALPDDAADAAKRRAAYEQFDREQEFEAERQQRMMEADPGVKN
jgi:hypothetical protein